jgi:hypothetical protein
MPKYAVWPMLCDPIWKPWYELERETSAAFNTTAVVEPQPAAKRRFSVLSYNVRAGAIFISPIQVQAF